MDISRFGSIKIDHGLLDQGMKIALRRLRASGTLHCAQKLRSRRGDSETAGDLH